MKALVERKNKLGTCYMDKDELLKQKKPQRDLFFIGRRYRKSSGKTMYMFDNTYDTSLLDRIVPNDKYEYDV